MQLKPGHPNARPLRSHARLRRRCALQAFVYNAAGEIHPANTPYMTPSTFKDGDTMGIAFDPAENTVGIVKSAARGKE